MTRSISRLQAMFLGLIILAAMALGGLALFTVGNDYLFGEALYVRADFKNISGVEVGTPVQTMGMKIGEVEAIELPEEQGKLTLRMRINGKYRHLISSQSTVQIYSDQVFSTAVRISTRKEGQPVIEDAATLASLPNATLANNLDKTVSELNQTLSEAKNTIAQIQSGSGPVGRIVSNLDESAAKLNLVMTETHMLVKSFRKGEGQMGVMVTDLGKATKKLNRVLDKVDTTMADLDDGKGTLGKLLKDEKLYTNLTKTLSEVNLALGEVRDGKGTLGQLLKSQELYAESLKSLQDMRQMVSSVKQNSDAIKSMPVVRSYVVDINKELNRPDCKRYRMYFAEHRLFEPGRAVLTAQGKKNLDAAAEWLNDRKHPGSEVVVATFANLKHRAEFADQLTKKQSEAVVAYLRGTHNVHRMGFWWWSNRTVKALGCGTAKTPVPESEELPDARIEIIVFVPEQ